MLSLGKVGLLETLRRVADAFNATIVKFAERKFRRSSHLRGKISSSNSVAQAGKVEDRIGLGGFPWPGE